MHPLLNDPTFAPCADLINAYQSCQATAGIGGKLLNKCQGIHKIMLDCLDEQRDIKREKNHKKALLRRKKWEDLNMEWWNSNCQDSSKPQ